MECRNCGATLRPGARFCNRCGKPLAEGAMAEGARSAASPLPVAIDQLPTATPAIDQLPTATPARPGAGQPAAVAPAQSSPRQQAGAPASQPSERVPRPPRPTRVPQPVEAAGPPPRSADVMAPAAPDAGYAQIADAETMEYGVMAAREKGGVHTVPLPDRGATAPLPPDGLPWPLPPHIIVGGRYRVERVLSSRPAEPSAENVYLVSDLQGYERCWSCHAAHSPEAAGLTICPECGADMLDRDYLLRERLLAPGETDTVVAGSTPGERVFVQGQRAYHVAPGTNAAPRFPHGVHVVAGAASDPGRARPNEPNQDSQGLLLLETIGDSRAEPLALAIVADGLGGHDSGLEASQLTVRTLIDGVLRAVVAPRLGGAGARLDGSALEHMLRLAVQGANTAVCQMNEMHRSDAGSTVVAALIVGETAYIANVGDSRAYALGHEGLKRVTTDHSIVEQYVANGVITEDERYDHPQRNQILRSLGEAGTEVDLFTLKLRPGMRLLLCSDGLWEMVRYDEMARILSASPHPQAACDALVRAANEHGGEDNISALVLEALA